jgi:hypothetical protein
MHFVVDVIDGMGHGKARYEGWLGQSMIGNHINEMRVECHLEIHRVFATRGSADAVDVGSPAFTLLLEEGWVD